MRRLKVDVRELSWKLERLDGRGYKAYKQLLGLAIEYEGAEAVFTRVQGDPFATPSIVELHVQLSKLQLPPSLLEGPGEVAFTDYVCRVVYRASLGLRRRRGSGYSGYMGYPRPGPWILKRSSVEVKGGTLIVRLYVGLPARGRRILGREAKAMLTDGVSKLIREVLGIREKVRELEGHIKNYLDQEYIRGWLERNDYMFFIGDGSILPRESSISEKPMRDAIATRSPDSLRVTMRLPSGRIVQGMAVPRGLLLITGGGYHGKTTLLEAIQQGIYNHIVGDGRELVVSRRRTLLVKAEDGRIVSHVDISGFIGRLPGGVDTSDFSSVDASGSTSMAASISEALEAGAEVILIDEDTSATNLLFKDDVMDNIIRDDPIKPLSTRVRELIDLAKVGVVIVSGSSSSFIEPADWVILMSNYVPSDITREAKSILRSRSAPQKRDYKLPRQRVFRGIRRLVKIRARGFKLVAQYRDGEKFELDLTYYPRIVEEGQVKTIACILEKLSHVERTATIPDLIEQVNEMMSRRGFESFTHPVPPDLTVVDGFDVVWVLNRLYNTVFTQK